jgi:hypothetical protein
MSRLKQNINGSSVRYECEDLDAGLQMHAHPPGSGQEHDIHCEVGSLIVYIHPDEHYIVKAGETIKPDTTKWHGIVPLEAGTVFINTNDLDNGVSSTVLESPHNAPSWVLAIKENIK